MYCSFCGATVAHNLTYCNHCGEKLNLKKGVSRAAEISPNTLVWAMVAAFVVGMAAITTGVTGMKKYGLDDALIYIFLGCSFLILLSLEVVYIWLLLSRRKVEKDVSSDSFRLTEQAIKELYATPARMITEPVPGSVVENTTHRLTPVYRDQKSS